MRKRKRKGRIVGRILKISGLLILLCLLFFVLSNLFIIADGKRKIVSEDALSEFNADCILILGAGLSNGGTAPSPMLADRLDRGIELYFAGVADKILVSGDHGQDNYDEVNVMKRYLMKAGIPDEDIFMDHAGFSTYESMYRAQAVFGVERVIVVTQEYHLYRSLYICRRLGIEAYGAAAEHKDYAGNSYRYFREWLARDKDVFFCAFRVKPKYLGEPVDIHGDGSVTND